MSGRKRKRDRKQKKKFCVASVDHPEYVSANIAVVVTCVGRME